MRRGELWWGDIPKPTGHRPFLILSRDEACQVRSHITVAPLSTRIRGIEAEVELDVSEGLPKSCIVNLDSILTIRKASLTRRISLLSPAKIAAVDAAICFALSIRPPENRFVANVPIE